MNKNGYKYPRGKHPKRSSSKVEHNTTLSQEVNSCNNGKSDIRETITNYYRKIHNGSNFKYELYLLGRSLMCIVHQTTTDLKYKRSKVGNFKVGMYHNGGGFVPKLKRGNTPIVSRRDDGVLVIKEDKEAGYTLSQVARIIGITDDALIETCKSFCKTIAEKYL